MHCVGLATGHRISGILALHVDHIDLLRHEVRIDKEKGSIGRVLPCSDCAIDVLRPYVEQAAPS
jgi:site-specific recombinase XerD